MPAIRVTPESLFVGAIVMSELRLLVVEACARVLQRQLKLFCRPDQCSLTNSYVDNNICLISEYLTFFIFRDVFAWRHLHIRMLRNDYTVPTRCRRRGGIVDPPMRQGLQGHPPADQTSKSNTLSLGPKSSKTSQFFCHQAFHRDRVLHR
jgi:hypothetical protein